jgi:hypothetical protein
MTEGRLLRAVLTTGHFPWPRSPISKNRRVSAAQSDTTMLWWDCNIIIMNIFGTKANFSDRRAILMEISMPTRKVNRQLAADSFPGLPL